jgi:hypothetical protein
MSAKSRPRDQAWLMLGHTHPHPTQDSILGQMSPPIFLSSPSVILSFSISSKFHKLYSQWRKSQICALCKNHGPVSANWRLRLSPQDTKKQKCWYCFRWTGWTPAPDTHKQTHLIHKCILYMGLGMCTVISSWTTMYTLCVENDGNALARSILRIKKQGLIKIKATSFSDKTEWVIAFSSRLVHILCLAQMFGSTDALYTSHCTLVLTKLANVSIVVFVL